MSKQSRFFNILSAESARASELNNDIGGLSAWNSDSTAEIFQRKIATAIPAAHFRISRKIDKKYSKALQLCSKNTKKPTTKHAKRLSSNSVNKATTNFTTYINSLITKNSQLIKKVDCPYIITDKQKKLEVISIRLIGSNENRVKSTSPERTIKMKKSKLSEDTFLIHEKIPPSVAGNSMTFYHRMGRIRMKSLNINPECEQSF
ncbi:hypothetical protein SteCoe_27051 [Stentor coeruleus]|uniref:Uncharacterized protein n=1 Tax=Stentor coeruleus TaxID=5963 RepID=A0A1R2BBF9_9CILI|nr:hypothetical protein SteCoe_27051 [Stentor coeruleus]